MREVFIYFKVPRILIKQYSSLVVPNFLTLVIRMINGSASMKRLAFIQLFLGVLVSSGRLIESHIHLVHVECRHVLAVTVVLGLLRAVFHHRCLIRCILLVLSLAIDYNLLNNSECAALRALSCTSLFRCELPGWRRHHLRRQCPRCIVGLRLPQILQIGLQDERVGAERLPVPMRVETPPIQSRLLQPVTRGVRENRLVLRLLAGGRDYQGLT